MKIHQALWGYSNGHHLLASSISLSNHSLKILGPLSDLSGLAVPKDFDGYLTGCFLPTENFYALSKTWYADEMPRLGCVWTHTLLLDCGGSADKYQIDLESLFQRPDVRGKKWQSFYASPIKLDRICKKVSVPSDIQNAAYCLLSLLTRHSEPIVAVANNNVLFNTAIEYLLGDMGIVFFKNFMFCTGSFSNREYNRTPLDLQIIPSSLSRASFRSKQSKIFFVDLLQYFCTHNLNAASVAKKEMPQVRHFVLSCGVQYYNYKDWMSFERIYDLIRHVEKFSAIEALRLLEKRISSKEDIISVMGRMFEEIFLSPATLQKEPEVLSSALLEFLSASDALFGKDPFVSEEVLKGALDHMWTLSRECMVHFLPGLIERGLNATGEEAVRYCAMLLTPNDFSLLLHLAPHLCTLFLHLNWRLALCRNIWNQSKSIQEESLYELQQIMAAKDCLPDECTNIIEGIYRTSQYQFSKELYNTFGDISIDVFFAYFETWKATDEPSIQQWCDICEYNQKLAIQKLKCVQNPRVFQAVIAVLDPYKKDILIEYAEVWNDFYLKFCSSTESESLEKIYAQFVLPIILCAKEPFAIECVEFAFLTVHKILTENDMEHSKWEKLSGLLPEVKWFNEWDKCKRLRMAAEYRGYAFDFGIN